MKQFADVPEIISPQKKLLLYCQKIVRLKSSAIYYQEHHELFIRMLGRNEILLSPHRFLPKLTEANLLASLDKWVLNEALTQIIKRHHNTHKDNAHKQLYNINLSAQSVFDYNFINFCGEIFDKNLHLAQSVCFEISEITINTDFQKALEFINSLRQTGCKFAIDNFGKGGAKLDYLLKLPVDFVKIDGLYVSDIATNPVSQVIVESICKVAAAVNAQIIAEKVETIAVEDVLLSLGVQYIQGFKIQQPIPFSINEFQFCADFENAETQQLN